MTTDGKIKNRTAKRTIFSFEGLHFGKASPTDVDFLIEHRFSRSVIFAEGKHYNLCVSKFNEHYKKEIESNFGQIGALKKIVDLLSHANANSALFIYKYGDKNKRAVDMVGDYDVIVSECTVCAVYRNGVIKYMENENLTMKDGINLCIDNYGIF